MSSSRTLSGSTARSWLFPGLRLVHSRSEIHNVYLGVHEESASVDTFPPLAVRGELSTGGTLADSAGPEHVGPAVESSSQGLGTLRPERDSERQEVLPAGAFLP